MVAERLREIGGESVADDPGVLPPDNEPGGSQQTQGVGDLVFVRTEGC